LQFVIKNLPKKKLDLQRDFTSPNIAYHSATDTPVSEKPIERLSVNIDHGHGLANSSQLLLAAGLPHFPFFSAFFPTLLLQKSLSIFTQKKSLSISNQMPKT
jgi:hypothetical protein